MNEPTAYQEEPDATLQSHARRTARGEPRRIQPVVAPEPQAVVYLRVSSKRQMDTAADIDPEGNSIATQREFCLAKARKAGATVVREFVEPGNSAQTIEKRPIFRELLLYLTENPGIDYVIIYMRSRAFRNLGDAVLTKRRLERMQIKLLSAKEDFGEGIMADAMEAVTDIINEVQVRMSGEDIKIKMRHKAENGGTVSRARLGYKNIRIDHDGRMINTIGLDEERAALVRTAWSSTRRVSTPSSGYTPQWPISVSPPGPRGEHPPSRSRPASCTACCETPITPVSSSIKVTSSLAVIRPSSARNCSTVCNRFLNGAQRADSATASCSTTSRGCCSVTVAAGPAEPAD